MKKKNGIVSIVVILIVGLFLGLAGLVLTGTLPGNKKTVSVYDASLKVNEKDVNPLSDFEFEKVQNGWKITKYINTIDKDVIIPSKQSDGKKIIAIGKDAFKSMDLTSVAIPNSILLIEDNAFQYNKMLNVIVPHSVKELNRVAFNNNSLISVSLPKGLKEITSDAFSENGLLAVTIPDGVIKIKESAFMRNKLTSLIIPNSVLEIDFQALIENELETVVLSDKLQSIGFTAFAYNHLKAIIIPASVKTMAWNAFKDNDLTSIEFLGNPPEVESVEFIQPVGDAGIFSNNDGLIEHSIKVPVGTLAAYQNLADAYGVEIECFYE